VVVDVVVGAASVLVLVVDVVALVADSVLVTVAVFDVLVLLEPVAVAACAVVVVFAVVGGAEAVVVVGFVSEEDVAVVVWLFVLLVICVRVFEMLLVMLDAPPEPHPATETVRVPTSVVLNSIDRTRRLTLIALSVPRI
jgi:hypothetical protein